MSFNTFDEFLSFFPDSKKTSSGRYQARCPSHGDGTDPARWSLSIWQDHEKILLKCFAGCTNEQIVASVGLEIKDLFLAIPGQQQDFNKPEVSCSYDYVDENNKLLFQVLRYVPKNFKQRHPDGTGGWIWNMKGVRRVIYHLPDIIKNVFLGRVIFICEGEKDVDNLIKLGCVATCNPMGAGKWQSEYNAWFKNAKVVVIEDKDKPDPKTGKIPGKDHANHVCSELKKVALCVYKLILPGDNVKDASDWIEHGGTKEQLRDLVSKLEEWTPDPNDPEIEGMDNPVIDASFIDIPKLANESIEALIRSNDPPTLFVRSAQLARVNQDEHGLPIIETLNEGALRGRLARSARFVKSNSKGHEFTIAPPPEIVKDLMTLGKWKLPALSSITETPTIREDGTILSQPGYDTKTELFYVPAENFNMPNIADKPSKEDVLKAKEYLLEIICDFPFENDASRANTIAALMTPVLRPLIHGPVPLVLFDAPQAGTGKSLLSDITSLISTGRSAAVLTAPSTDDEDWRKAITSLLMLGRNVVTIDNIEGKLSSASLASVLTSNYWQDRILGRSEMIIIPHRTTWIGTGNNIRLGGDLPRRCYWVKIDAKNARPWQRNGFKHPHLIEWVTEHRGDILAAILTIARAWLIAGKPCSKKGLIIGSFEKWCDILSSIMEFSEIPDFLGNLESMYEQVDEDTPQWEGFLTSWHTELGAKFYTLSEVVNFISQNKRLEESLPMEFSGSIEKTTLDGGSEKVKIDRNFTRKLGRALAKRVDVQYSGGLNIQKGKTEQRALTWRIVINHNGQTDSQNSQFDMKI